MITIAYKDIGNIEPVSIAEAKEYLGQASDHHDTMIQHMVTAARERAELYMNRTVLDKTITLTLDKKDFPDSRVIKLVRGPVKEVVKVRYKNTDGDWVTVAPADYQLSILTDPGILVIPSLSHGDIKNGIAVMQVEYTTGWGDRTIDGVQYKNPLPETIRTAIMMMMRTMYDQRDEFVRGTIISRLPEASEALLDGIRLTEFR